MALTEQQLSIQARLRAGETGRTLKPQQWKEGTRGLDRPRRLLGSKGTSGSRWTERAPKSTVHSLESDSSSDERDYEGTPPLH